MTEWEGVISNFSLFYLADCVIDLDKHYNSGKKNPPKIDVLLKMKLNLVEYLTSSLCGGAKTAMII